jgi:phosphohistidine phosphatase
MDGMAPERQLVIMRHAKAGELPGGPDFERALRPRGRRNAESAGAWLAGQGLVPEFVVCSKARRTRQTWQHVSATLGGSPAVSIDQRLYHADAEDLLGILAETDPGVRILMYVGHNPAVADLTELLVDEPIGFPTAAIAVVGITPEWSDLFTQTGSGELLATWTPQAEQ